MKNKIIILLAVVALSFFGFTNVITAATIFTDNFNTYPLYSTLNGQGGWVSDGNNGQIIDYIVYEGEQSARISELNGEFFSGVTKTGTLLNDGQITIYARSIGGGNFTGQPKIELKEGSTSIIKIQVAGSLGYAYYNGDVGGFTSLGSASNPWIAFQIQWRSSDHKARYNIDGGPWTGWHSGLANWTSGLDTVGIYSRDGVSIFDAIQENLVNYKTPVLIVPGLVGTEIYNNGSEKLWLDLNHNFADIGDEFMDPLSFSEYLYPAHNSLSIGDIIRKPNIIFDYSEGLITELKNQGYIENQDLFTFPYDWRYGVSGKYPDGKTNSDLLKEKIHDILTQTGGDKVDVIAHSLGGLVVKKYAIDNSVSHYIGKAIFVGVPNTGAPKSIKALLQGDNFGIPWLSESEIKKISANMPTAYDLLPTQQYYNTVGSFVKVIDEGSLFDLFDYTEKDLTYDEFKNYATNDHGLNSLALTGAESLHTADFDNFDLRSAGIDLYAIDGCKKGTMEQIVEYRYGDLVKYKNVKFKTGDGTVPISSSTNLPVNSSNKFYFLNADHGKMLSQDGGLQKIVNLITGSNLATGDNITQDIAQCHLNGKAISVYSPVDIFVTDQNGNQMGLAADGSIVNEIPNAAFEVMGQEKFLYLPTDEGQTYDIKMQGTGTGTYTITSQNIADSQTTSTEVFSNLPVTPTLTGHINLSNQTTLSIQETPESATETITPSATLNADQSEDVAPPISTATLSGTQGQPGFYRSDVMVTITAADGAPSAAQTASGLLSISYQIAAGPFQKTPNPPLSLPIIAEGPHAITFFSTDNAGNNELKKTLTFTIDKTPPEAVIEFDPALRDLKFSATQEGVAAVDQGSAVTLTDQAGNTTQITLEEKNRLQSMSAHVRSLTYNGVAADINKNTLQYIWSYDKTNHLKNFFQQVTSRKDYNIVAHYSGKTTKVAGQDQTGVISQSFTGLKIIKVTTNRGNFEWGY